MQIDNATATIGASERMYNLNTRNNLSKMNTFIALIIILTFGVVGYVVADGIPTIQYIVLIIVSVLLLIVAILYILDTQRKVRTDGAKIYWGQPTEAIQRLK
jgi:membrane protein implicated in regulation of membrane protease activity